MIIPPMRMASDLHTGKFDIVGSLKSPFAGSARRADNSLAD
jgi:hypothetical protein